MRFVVIRKVSAESIEVGQLNRKVPVQTFGSVRRLGRRFSQTDCTCCTAVRVLLDLSDLGSTHRALSLSAIDTPTPFQTRQIYCSAFPIHLLCAYKLNAAACTRLIRLYYLRIRLITETVLWALKTHTIRAESETIATHRLNCLVQTV